MSTATQTTGHTTTKNLVAGMRVIFVSKGQTLGGGEIVAVAGRTVTIAQVIEHSISSDMGVATVVSTELALDDYTVSRSIVAWEI